MPTTTMAVMMTVRVRVQAVAIRHRLSATHLEPLVMAIMLRRPMQMIVFRNL